MAARKTPYLAEKTKERIKASMLMNALRDHALGERKMSSTQIRAAEILLKKVVPDLQSIEMVAEVEHKSPKEAADHAATILNAAGIDPATIAERTLN